MTREQVKQVLPLMQAFAEGKTIQTKNGSGWIDIDSDKDQLILDSVVAYQDCFRIKPEHKYRPFKDAEECWQEMKNHQPFGWVKAQGQYRAVTRVADGVLQLNNAAKILGKILYFDDGLRYLSFADGTPFGIKEGTDD